MKTYENSPSNDKPSRIKLLERYIGEYYSPLFWDEDVKSKNYFAKITQGTSTPFNRSFINNTKLDEKVMFKRDAFKEGDIMEQRSTFKKGKTTQTNFSSFYIICLQEDGIYGEEISQKDTIEYFECRKCLPEVTVEQKTQLKSKLHLLMTHLNAQYGHQLVMETLTELIAEYLPEINVNGDCPEETA